MSLTAGTRLGPYEVVAPLGAGGMGEVYRARDARLKRDVAIKRLPGLVAGDPERLARFQREAEILAALDHPSIAGIHGLEDAAGSPALVLELVEGDTLADRIARGPIPLDEALPLAAQIAAALEYAHERGVVHRDLKPANIKVTPEGMVKVLDFGLAKALAFDAASADAVDAALSPTLTAVSQAGVLLGTAAYMSPEQARGQAADRRSDVWAFGCVLYEMLTGRRMVAGQGVSDILAEVLKGSPDWTALPAATPVPVRRLLRRALEKDRAQRLADMGGARLEIADALVSTEDGDPDVTTSVPVEGGASHPRWVVTRQDILFRTGGAIMRVPYTVAGGILRPGAPRRLHDAAIEDFDVHPDGERLVVETFTDAIAEQGRDTVVLIQNAFDELRRLVPPR